MFITRNSIIYSFTFETLQDEEKHWTSLHEKFPPINKKRIWKNNIFQAQKRFGRFAWEMIAIKLFRKINM